MNKSRLNQMTADKLDAMNLSDRAQEVIASTDINIMYETFGSFETAEEVEIYINEYYSED